MSEVKEGHKKYGKLPSKEAEHSKPWKRVNIDMIGPLTVGKGKDQKQLNALTMINLATGWFEVAPVEVINSDSCQAAFDDYWLNRYPRPEFIGFDNGKEFKAVFKEMQKNYGLKKKPSTNYNPQSNGIVERVHQVLNDALRTFELDELELDPVRPWDRFLSMVAFAVRSTYHTTLEATPGQLVFGRDMLLPVKFKYDWAEIRRKQQKEILRNNECENNARVPYTYAVGEKVFVKKKGTIRKLATPKTGPYSVERVYDNGTVTVRKGPVSERMNIRRLEPCFEVNDRQDD